jgi:non-specific serine/threonine protein kinase
MMFGPVHRSLGELPRELTGFIGRGTDLALLRDVLGTSRCVTVLGPGGVGKTRLALRTLSEQAGTAKMPVCLVELSGLRDGRLLPQTLAACLGLPEQVGRTQLNTVLDRLRQRPVLLLLDTCEHLVGACAELVGTLLRETDGVRILATSREPLGVPGERTFPLAPLDVRDDGGDAVSLFEQCAASVLPGFEVTEANIADAVRLCRRLDGIPLAIELAAVRLRGVPLRRLTDRLENRFLLLTGGRGTAMPRHRTLRAAIDWSYDLCDTRQRLLWARLSVFGDSFDLCAAEDVCGFGELESQEVLEVLVGLVDKSLLQRVDAQKASPGDEGEARYRMLDTLREYGAEKLAGSGEETAVRDRHLERYATAAHAFDRHFVDDDQMARCRSLHREHPEIRVALEYALGRGDRAAEGAGMAGALWGYWQITGLLTEGVHWQRKSAEAFPGTTPERAWALIVGAFITVFQGNPAAAVPDLLAGIEIAEKLDAARIRARGWLYLQVAYTFLCDFERAEQARITAQGHLTATGDLTGLVSLDVQAGYQYHLSGQDGLALERSAQGLARLGGASQECWLRGFLYTVAGIARYAKGEAESSEAALRQALPIKAELGDSVGCGYAVEIMAWLAAHDGRHRRAAWLLGGSAALWQSAGSALMSGAPVSLENHRRAVEATRDGIGPDLYERLWQSGRAAPREALLDAALSGASDLAPRSEPAALPGSPGGSLTGREREVALLAAEGRSNREIAEHLVISRRTVDSHMDRILDKLGIDSRRRIAARLADGRR